jgi:hypothetical protein
MSAARSSIHDIDLKHPRSNLGHGIQIGRLGTVLPKEYNVSNPDPQSRDRRRQTSYSLFYSWPSITRSTVQGSSSSLDTLSPPLQPVYTRAALRSSGWWLRPTTFARWHTPRAPRPRPILSTPLGFEAVTPGARLLVGSGAPTSESHPRQRTHRPIPARWQQRRVDPIPWLARALEFPAQRVP